MAFRKMREDVVAVLKNDPAAKSVPEVVLCYSGVHAVWFYRVDHWLWPAPVRTLALSGFAVVDRDSRSTPQPRLEGVCSLTMESVSSSEKPL
jgi:hypothetical protein